MDRLDRKILEALQRDGTLSAVEISRHIGVSDSPGWRRIKRLEDSGVIKSRVVLLDPIHLNVGITAFVYACLAMHSEKAVSHFSKIVAKVPEIVECYRMSGNTDYIFKVVVPDITVLDSLVSQLIKKTGIQNVRTRFASERLKSTTELPLNYLLQN